MNSGTFSTNRGISPSYAIADAFRARVLADGGTFEGYDHLVSTIKMMRHKGIYDKASIILTPNGFKDKKLYTLKSTAGNTDFVFGGGGGSRMNAGGNMVPVPPNTPKIDYSSGFPEIVLERGATNVLQNSATLQTQTININQGTYVLSFYGSGTITVNESIPVVLSGTGPGRVFTIFSSTGGSKTFTVSGEVKYAQLEQISNTLIHRFPTSWIPTTASSVTRSISSLQLTGIQSLINQNEGTVCFEVKRKGRGILFRLDDSTNNNSIRFFNTGTTGNTIETKYVKNGQESNIGTTTINIDGDIKVALRYNIEECRIYINGTYYITLLNNGIFSNLLNRISFTTTESTINNLVFFAYVPEYLTIDDLNNFSNIA